jgi:hypothetical protein
VSLGFRQSLRRLQRIRYPHTGRHPTRPEAALHPLITP